eukprot:1185797-Prorocentrum_minimum.AAC.2
MYPYSRRRPSGTPAAQRGPTHRPPVRKGRGNSPKVRKTYQKVGLFCVRKVGIRYVSDTHLGAHGSHAPHEVAIPTRHGVQHLLLVSRLPHLNAPRA